VLLQRSGNCSLQRIEHRVFECKPEERSSFEYCYSVKKRLNQGIRHSWWTVASLGAAAIANVLRWRGVGGRRGDDGPADSRPGGFWPLTLESVSVSVERFSTTSCLIRCVFARSQGGLVRPRGNGQQSLLRAGAGSRVHSGRRAPGGGRGMAAAQRHLSRPGPHRWEMGTTDGAWRGAGKLRAADSWPVFSAGGNCESQQADIATGT
jgi:hypothetical protein